MTTTYKQQAADTQELHNGDLPEGWESAKLPEIAKINMGQSPPGRSYNNRGDGLPFFQGKTDFGDRYPTVRVWCSQPKKTAHPGDLLISVRTPVGPTNVADRVCAIGRGLAAITPLGRIPSEFILFRLRVLEPELALSGTGSTFSAISRKDLDEIDIGVPPLPEQERIVAKVEELLERVNTTKERLAKVSMILKRFRRTTLAAACSGRLTADWREANRVQDDFEETTIGEIAEYFGGFAYKSKTFLKQGQHQVIRIGNVRLMSLNLQASPVFIPDPVAQQTERFRLHPDDIVISMTGTKYKKDYGFAAIVRESNGNLFLNQRVARLRCGDRGLPKYLLYWLQTDTFHDFFFAGETGNVNQGNVGADGIRKAPIKLPSLCEQQEIVRRGEALFKLANAIEERVAAASLKAGKMTRAILTKAFRGELVPTEAELARRDGRSYESASELLARIKADRESRGASKTSLRNPKKNINPWG